MMIPIAHKDTNGGRFNRALSINSTVEPATVALKPTTSLNASGSRSHNRREFTMNRGIETAFWGVLGRDPELKTSKTGTAYTGMNVVVPLGQRVTCFNDTAKAIAAKAKKGDRVYIEGSLTLNQWNDGQGEVRHGLNVAAWKCERVASIGKNRERKPGAYQANGDTPSSKSSGRAGRDFDDPMPF